MAESLTTPATLPQTIAENGDATVIPATNDQTEGKASIAYGFPPLTSTPIADGGKMVRRADFNGLFNLLSQYALFAQNGGLFTFDASVSAAIGGYPLGSRLVYTDSDGKSHIVRSLIPNNTYNFVSDPTYIDGLKWGYTFVDFDENNIFTQSQTIKTADADNWIDFIDTTLSTNESIPTDQNHDKGLELRANDNSLIGQTAITAAITGENLAGVYAYKKVGGTVYASSILAIVKSDGTVSTYAPTPASTSKTTEIATTEWVSDLLNGGSGWVYLGNKIGLCYGHEGGVTSAGKQITLPHAFDSTAYNAIAVWDGWNATAGANVYTGIYNHTTTKMTLYSNSTAGVPISWIAIGPMTIVTKP